MWSSSGITVYADGSPRWTWNTDNVFSVGWDLNPLAMQIGAGADGVRDSLGESRDHFLQPLMQQYRFSVYPASGFGGHAAEDDFSLYHDAAFQNWVQTGAVPVPQQSIDDYQKNLISQVAAAPPPGMPLNAAGGIDQTDANVISWLESHGVNTQPTGKLIAPIAGSDIFNGTINLPNARNSGALTTSPALAGTMAAANGGFYAAGVADYASGGGSSKWLILLAAAAAAYFLLKGNS